MKTDYKAETIDFLQRLSDTFGEEIATKFKCIVDSECAAEETEEGEPVIRITFHIIDAQEP